MTLRMQQPTDPYDTEAWMAFYAANPGWRRGVGAEGVNDDSAAAADPATAADPASDGTPPAADPASDGTPPAADRAPATDDKKSGLSDKEAELLRESMKRKAEIQELKKRYEGVDPDKYREMLAAQQAAEAERAEAERKKLEAEGNFEEVKRQMNEAHEAQISQFQEQLTAKDSEVAELRRQLAELTIGNGFETSSFLREQTVLPPSKARALYGSYFELEDGKPVAYDRPKGAEGRAPLVDARGEPLAFEAAIEKIVKSDPDWESLGRARVKPGADSKPGSDTTPPAPQKPMSSHEKILSGLGSLMSQKGNDMPTLS